MTEQPTVYRYGWRNNSRRATAVLLPAMDKQLDGTKCAMQAKV